MKKKTSRKTKVLNHKKLVWGLISATFLLCFGIIALDAIPRYAQNYIESQLNLGRTGPHMYFDVWQDSQKHDIPRTLSLYIMNCTNAVEVVKGARPQLQEIGPYVYIQHSYKELHTMNWRVNGTLQFRYHNTYIFQPQLSLMNGKQLSPTADMITHVNVGIAALGNLMETIPDLDDIMLGLLEDLITVSNDTMFQVHSFDELYWGFNDTILTWIQKYIPFLPNRLQFLKRDDPQYFSSPSEVHTGADSAPLPAGMTRSVDAIGWLTMWAGMRQLNYWNSTYANMINGSDIQFHPRIKDGEVLRIFVDIIYRSVYVEPPRFHFSPDTSLKGVPLKRFVLAKQTLAANYEFYQKYDGAFAMPPSLILPILMTKPYFMDTDPHLMVNVSMNGNYPPVYNRDFHDTMLDVEPMSGCIFHVSRNLQFNIFVGPIKYANGTTAISVTKHLMPTYYPVGWAGETMFASDFLADMFHLVHVVLDAAFYGGISALILFGVVVVSLFFSYRRAKSREVTVSSS